MEIKKADPLKFLKGVLIIVMIYFVLKIGLEEVQPLLCEQGLMCGESAAKQWLTALYVVVCFGFGYWRSQKT